MRVLRPRHRRSNPRSGRAAAAFVVLAAALLSAVPGLPAERMSPDPMEDAYRHALGAWASGEPARGAAELARLIPLAEEKPGCRAHLQLHVAQALAERHREALIPIAAFHLAGYLEMAATSPRGPPLEMLSVIERIVDIYLARPERAEVRERAALTLAVTGSLGRRVRVESHLSQSRHLLERALKLAPGDPVVVAALADVEEKSGRYGRAAGRFAELVALDPDDPRARLGLGLNRLRSGGREEGEQTLTALARGGAPEWVRSVAYEELARHQAERGQRDAAVALLLEATAALPDDPQPAIQLALLLEPDRDRGTALLAGALAPGGSPPPSPRAVYDLGPEERIAGARRRFEHEAGARKPELLRGLRRIDDSERFSGLPCQGVEP